MGFCQGELSREAQLFVGWVSGSVTHRGVGFHASTQPTFILYLIPPTYLSSAIAPQNNMIVLIVKALRGSPQ
ncbi:MAG: hypothetical protein EWV56_11880 [Microcystis aeruginosa Ma_QC_C_20070823_S13D]|nr:MAG: hypothetical protein EWV56_11880 [Microcystis aeruginosa Ma_QC_C_20070823_S13D]